MKKIFTSISALAMLFATTFTGSAQNQPQLTSAEKTAIAKEIVPAILDQVKTISGLDIIGLANPTIESIVTSPMFFQQGLATRAATPTVIDVVPDSMTLNLSSIDMGSMGDMGAVIKPLLEKVKLTFSEPKDFTFAMGVRPVSVKLPHKIVASVEGLGELMTVSFTSGDKGVILPFNSFKAELKFGAMLANLAPMLGDKLPIKEGVLLTIGETKESNGTLTYSIVMGDALRGMVATMAEVPNFAVTLDMTKLMTAGTIKASLFGKPLQAPSASIPMGDAVVHTNLKATAGMPADSIILTSYGLDTKVNGFRKLAPVMSVDGANLKLTTTSSVCGDTNGDGVINNSDLTSWAPQAQQIITMPASLSSTFSDMMSSIVGGIIGGLKADLNSQYDIKIDSVLYKEGVAQAPKSIMVISIATKLEAVSIKESNVIATIDIKKPETTLAAGDPVSVMSIKATMPTTDQKMKIEFTPAGLDAPMATAFVKSNALGVVTGNEASPEFDEAKVYVQDGGIYVENCGNATYSVVSMNGAHVAQGTISGTNEYVPVSSLARNNIYIIKIAKGNAAKTFKIKAK